MIFMRLPTSLLLFTLWGVQLGRGQEGASNDALTTPFFSLPPLPSLTLPSIRPVPSLHRSRSSVLSITSRSASFPKMTSIVRSTESAQATSSAPAGVSTQKHENRISSPVVAAIAVALSIFFLCLPAILLWHIRRRRHRHAAEITEMRMGGGVATISPFTLTPEVSSSPGARTALCQDSDLRSISASPLTRQRLETQLCAATEKMVDHQAQEELAGYDPGGSGMHRMPRRMSTQNTSTRLPEVEAQLQAAREQIDVLVTRINALEENSDSAWERVTGDEPPPEYV